MVRLDLRTSRPETCPTMNLLRASCSRTYPHRSAKECHTFGHYKVLRNPRTRRCLSHTVFFGIQLQCAECHKHPFDAWTQSDFSDFARFFESVTPNHRSSAGDESIELSLLRSRVVTLSDDDDPRRPIMDWMGEDDNPWFARAFVNRVWAGYFHVGIVDPPDQFTPANPPSNPALLDWLTHGFCGERLRHEVASSPDCQQ